MKKYLLITVIAALFFSSCVKDEQPQPAAPTPESYTDIVINELITKDVTDPYYIDGEGNGADWIELHNKGNKAVNIAGMWITDNPGVETDFIQIPEGSDNVTTIPPKGFLVLICGANDETGAGLPTSITDGKIFLDMGLSSSKDSHVAIYTPQKEEVDQSDDFNGLEDDISFGRTTDGGDEWATLASKTPGAPNDGSSPTEGTLVINEFMARNDSWNVPGDNGDQPDWIEIYNPGTEDVMLGGYYMADDLTDSSAMYQIPDTYPDSVTVPAGGYIVFYANKGDGSSVLNLNFKLSGGGEQIGLWDPDKNFLDSLTYEEQITDTSYGRFPNGADTWYIMGDITPGAANTNPNPEPGEISLYINEFMASNDFAVPGPQGDYPDWIEIYNAGEDDVMLGGYYMADDLADPGAMYQIPDTYPDSVTVPAGGFIVFYANKDEATSVLNLNFKLSGSGEQIGLWDPDMNVIDSLSYGAQSTDTSFGRYTDGSGTWYVMPDYTPGEPNRYTSAIDENTMNVTQVQNFPNPFAYITNIEFTLAKSDKVVITVYSISGKKVALLADEFFSAGQHIITWNGSSLPAGYYFYSVKFSEGTIVKKSMIIK
jgi:hypothetical protein